jgi:PAS domain S-box-containing protein
MPEIARAVHAEQVRLLYRQLPYDLIATVIVSALLAAALWDEVAQPLIIIWLALMQALSLGRYLLLRAYQRAAPAVGDIPAWGRKFVATTAIGGVGWGAIGVVFSPGPNIIELMLIPFVLGGISAGGASSLSSLPIAYPVFLIPTVLPFAGRLLLHDDTLYLSMGMMALLYVAMMLAISRRLGATITTSLELHLQNLALLRDLTLSKERLQAANQTLAAEVVERRRAEEAVRQSEQRLILHVQRTPLAVVEWDLEFRAVAWNPAAERIFGYSKEEAVGRTVLELIVPAGERERVLATWHRLLVQRDGTHSTDQNLTRDGRIITCEWYHTPLVNEHGWIIGIASLAQDITERKLAEQALRLAHDELERRVQERTEALAATNEALQSEISGHQNTEHALQRLSRQYQLILDSAGEGIFGIDRHGSFAFVNRAAGQMLGRPAAELMGQPVEVIMQCTDNDGDSWAELCALLANPEPAEAPIRIDEARFRKRDGSSLPIECLITPVKDDAAIRSVVIFKDITERKRIEVERTAYARQQRQALVREIHHRIKNNLQGVIGILGLQVGYHPEAKLALDLAMGQLQSVATVYGLQSKNATSDIELFDMIVAISNALESLIRTPIQATLEHAGAPHFLVVRDEAVPLALVLNELLTNAAKHGLPSQPIKVCLSGAGDCAQVCITNPGTLPAGFDFDHRRGLGTGLGLVKSMLPPNGACLALISRGGEVTAQLELRPPVLTLRSAA